MALILTNHVVDRYFTRGYANDNSAFVEEALRQEILVGQRIDHAGLQEISFGSPDKHGAADWGVVRQSMDGLFILRKNGSDDFVITYMALTKAQQVIARRVVAQEVLHASR